LKSNTPKYLFLFGILIFFVACSTKKNTFITRNYHAITAEYNILYNGGVALEKGVSDLKLQYNDNFWETLPVERMRVLEEELATKNAQNSNFALAEKKATKAIQKHSINIDGTEKNPQMDEAHLMLGKARYYDQRFVPALEAFNYVLYKYPKSSKIYEVKIWREKTNMRMENDAVAVNNLRKLLKEIKFKNQIFADANATLAQAFLNLKETDSAIAKIKIAKEFTKDKEEEARYNFILGQIYETQNHKDSAFAAYQEVIDMKRKSPRQYVIQAHSRQAKQFDFENGDTIAFLKKFNGLLEDRENRPFLDILNHQMGLFYDKQKNTKNAKKYYNTSLKSNSKDDYLTASNYRNLAEIYFNETKYVTTGKYLDSTLVYLNDKTREFKAITKKRENLDDVIKFEGIAQKNDSILKLASLSSLEKEQFFTTYIDNLKKEEEKAKLEKQKQIDANQTKGKESLFQPNTNEAGSSKTGDFYFYNPITVAYGKTEFEKQWGKRIYGPNWRWSSNNENPNSIKDDQTQNNVAENSNKIEDRFTTEFYIKQIPTSKVEIDSISKERNFAYYQLGVIYKEKFKEYKRSASKFETLLENNPEERLVLPTLYNLYKIYQIIDTNKATAIKNRIITDYPNSRYAQLLNDNKIELESNSPEAVYNTLYKEYESGLYRETLPKTENAIIQFSGEEMLPKFELLKAILVGKLTGLTEYKKALNFVALTYPNTQEGKETETFIATKIPLLEALYFNSEPPISWKIIFAPNNSLDEKSLKPLIDKLNKYAQARTIEKLTISKDVYTKDKNLIVIHGIKSEENAKGIALGLKELKEYKISEPSIIISNENYKIVQIYKNMEEYILGKGPTFEQKTKPTIVLPAKEVPKNKIQKAQRTDKTNNTKNNKNSQFNENPMPLSGQDNNGEDAIGPPMPNSKR